MPILQQNLHLSTLTGTDLKNHPSIISKKYIYAFVEISPISKVWWLLRSGWKHELKLSHNSSDTKGDALRTNVKIEKWNESFSRQHLSQSCLFKSLKVKTKKKENITQQNYKFRPLNISINCSNVISFDIYLKRGQNRKLKTSPGKPYRLHLQPLPKQHTA